MIKKILIANRGEIALRIIRSCRELGIKTVAIYSKADKNSLHVKFADEAVCIGPNLSNESYLNISSILSAVELTNADAIHPGYGFLSENSHFAEVCAEHNIIFIGPNVDSIERMGDKSTAKKTMIAAGVPVIPGSKELLESKDQALDIAKNIGFPVIIKATAGGGGKGMRLIRSKDELEKGWDSAKREAAASFKNDGLYMEKYIEEPHHIEIQILGDKHGKVIHLSERDCSIQRRHQKLIEETPSPFIDQKIRKKIGKAAIKASKYINYMGAGTIEFLVDKNKDFYFMEMNTRIQVEHPITEEVTSTDLIKEQILIANNEKLKFDSLFPQLHSIECRINAEDPEKNFMPSPGTITNLHLPGGNGIRIDTHIYSGYTIPPYYDSMVAKLISTANTREEAINKMSRALQEFIIEGIKTTIPLHLKILKDKNFRMGQYDTSFIEKNKNL